MVLRSLEGFKALHGAELPKQSSGDSIHDPRTEQAKERAKELRCLGCRGIEACGVLAPYGEKLINLVK